ncbi:hypothetical protein Q3G72_005229 [Acer saccharum]|nr:hypothetical protein Q3G72_005229 [Acer saccharum]
MGSILSVNSSRTGSIDASDVSQNETCKRQRLSPSIFEESPRLIPSLPDEISFQILARLPRIYYLKVKLVSRAWKAVIMSSELFKLRKELGMTEEWLYILTKAEDDKFFWHTLDPLSRRWQRLPPMPRVGVEDESRKGLAALRMWNVVGSSIKIADVIRGWLGRKDALDRLSFCGSSIGTVDGCLYVLGGFSRAVAMTQVWRYDPVINAWSEVSPMSIGRAYYPSTALDSAKIKVYDYQDDTWKIVVGDVPIANFTDTESPYLLAGLLGKLHVVTKDANHNIAVLQADVKNRFASLPSASSSSIDDSLNEHVVSETNPWKIIATRNTRSVELVSCQTLDI